MIENLTDHGWLYFIIMIQNLTWFGWLYLIMAVAGWPTAILLIDRPREPVTPLAACFYIFFSLFFLWGVFNVGVTHR